jgi:uncharacterized BrkB/YihY/UPF0761 family membrane protein
MQTMDALNNSQAQVRNPVTHARHRREVFWQIIFPLLIGFLLVVAVLVLMISSGTSTATDVSRWADVSLIWLILPSLFIALLILIILVAIIYLVTVVLQVMPRYARIVQLYFEIGKYKISHIANRVTEPIIKLRSFWAVVHHPGRYGKRPEGEP